jgi:phage repressor protein C with HTH and peptisase S24 domain
MKKPKRRTASPEWAARITAMRKRLKISQGQLAKLMECSAMTVSRWERGLLAPSAQYYIRLGNLGNKAECWFFWERAGLQMANVARVFPASSRAVLPATAAPELERASAGVVSAASRSSKGSEIIALPVLKAVAGTHGGSGDKKMSLSTIPATQTMGAPAAWCPNPRYTSLLRVKGHSMEPLIHDGDILAIDSIQTERSELEDKVVIVNSEERGLCVSRLRRYQDFEVLESENREYQPIVLNKASGWRVVAKVLWWISAAP